MNFQLGSFRFKSNNEKFYCPRNNQLLVLKKFHLQSIRIESQDQESGICGTKIELYLTLCNSCLMNFYIFKLKEKEKRGNC